MMCCLALHLEDCYYTSAVVIMCLHSYMEGPGFLKVSRHSGTSVSTYQKPINNDPQPFFILRRLAESQPSLKSTFPYTHVSGYIIFCSDNSSSVAVSSSSSVMK